MVTWLELSAMEVLKLLEQQAEQHNGSALSGFLDTHQWAPLKDVQEITLAGGHPQAQYRRAGFNFPEIPLRFFAASTGSLPTGVKTAPRLRSWLYHAGLPDSTLGDIVINDKVQLASSFDVDPEEVGLRVEPVKSWGEMNVPIQKQTAAGKRIDAVVGTVFKVSRGEAQKAIKHGFVYLNFAAVVKRSTEVKAGDQLVYRTKGRVAVLSLNTNPRSGREWVEFQSFPG